MIRYIARRIADKQINKGKILPENRAVFYYAFEICINSIFHIIISLLIGLCFGKILEMVLFLLFYSILRIHAGGYHASTRTRCTVISFCVVFIVMILNIPNYNMIHWIVLYTSLIVLSIAIVVLSPVEAINKPLNTIDKMRNKRSTIGIIAVLDVVSIVELSFVQTKVVTYNLILVYMAVFILQIFGVIKLNRYLSQGR